MDQQIGLEFAISNSKEGLLIMDGQGTIVAYNPRAKTLLDPISLAIGDSFPFESITCFHPEDSLTIPVSHTPFHQALQAEKLQQEQVIGIKKDAHHFRWLSLSSQWICEGDKPLVMISLFDVSSMITEQQDLIIKKKQLHLLVASINHIVFEVTKEGVFINYWTNSIDSLFYHPNHFLGKNMRDILPASITTPGLHLISEALHTGIEQEMDFLSPIESHKNRWYHLQVKPILRTEERVALVISDITEEVENREKIMLSENKFNKAFHYSGLGMSITALNGICLDANRSLCHMLGYNKEEMLALSFMECTHPEDVQKDIVLRNKLLENEIESFNIEKRYQHRSGHYVWCDITVSLVRNHRNHPQFFIAQIQNISGIKQNIEILQRQKAELETIKIDLEVKVRQLQEFNEIVAHNLRTPVSNIQMLVDALYQEKDESKKESYLTYLKESGDSLSQTLQELTDVLELNRHCNLSYVNCSFENYLHKTYLQHIAEIQANNAEMTADFEVTHIQYPSVYLESILNNLVSNALRFTRKGHRPKIHLSTHRENDKIILRISDNGIGIDLSKFKSQLFMFKKIFHRGFDGRGIGLFITRYQVENLGGKIDVESIPGKGTSFIIQF